MDFWKSQLQGEDVLTLSDLLNRVEKLIEECFPSFFWVVVEVAEIQERGHLYLELVKKEGESIKARIRGIIWSGNVHNIVAPFETVTG
ncbi:MAG: exodeoxyribonuclease VII large subunit [Candidatus Caldatribacteriaceae bacterium]